MCCQLPKYRFYIRYNMHSALRFLIGLHENDLVKCALIADVLNLRSVHVTPVSAKDWEIIVSTYLYTYKYKYI